MYCNLMQMVSKISLCFTNVIYNVKVSCCISLSPHMTPPSPPDSLFIHRSSKPHGLETIQGLAKQKNVRKTRLLV
jgi:hypothetical protein